MQVLTMGYISGVYPQNFVWSGVLVRGNFWLAMPTFLISKLSYASVNFAKIDD